MRPATQLASGDHPSGSATADDAAADRVAGEVDPVAQVELLENVVAVPLDGLFADQEQPDSRE
jgi:hypothetical protein